MCGAVDFGSTKNLVLDNLLCKPISVIFGQSECSAKYGIDGALRDEGAVADGDYERAVR